MITILVVESCRADFLHINKALEDATRFNYKVKHLASIEIPQLMEIAFDVLLFSETPDQEESFAKLGELVNLALPQPILFLSDHYDANIDNTALRLGADDCLPKSDLTAAFLGHSIQHALQRKKAEAKIAHLATHDSLTGLANRYLLQQHLEHAINLAKRAQSEISILFIDIDQFKLINESLGHETADQLLISVADKLRCCVRETDIVARLGNDEFAILLENSGNTRDIALIAEKIQMVMLESFYLNNQEIFITTSIGIASFPECGSKANKLIKCAESALHKAKTNGRNQFHFFTNELNRQAKLKLELEKNLRRALINREFDIFLQPQLCSKSHRIVGAEALLRWQHPKFGYISPVVFIPLLEELGLIVGVERWVISSVCREAKILTEQYGDLRFAINISGAHFKNGNLKENIYLALQSSSLDANFLEIELTEDIMIEHVERNSLLLSELKEIGISIALDDFGKGYSSLTYLKNFPADILKIDRSFVQNLTLNSRDNAIVESLIDLSHNLGLKVVAEGVEEINQLNQLTGMGCDYIQGFYFAKPMNREDFTRYIAQQFNAAPQKHHSTHQFHKQ